MNQYSIQQVFHIMEMLLVQNQGLALGNDANPAKENIPTADTISLKTSLYAGHTWGWDRINQCKVVIQTKRGFEGEWLPIGKKFYKIYFQLFPQYWLFDVCMEVTSMAIVKQFRQALEEGKFMNGLGIILVMTMCTGWFEATFWSPKPFKSPPISDSLTK